MPDAVVFGGQGSQRQGMGADFYQRWPVARSTFEEACDAAGENLTRICFEPDERLHLTEFTQPCVLTMEVAAYRVAVEEFGFAPRLFGGHSLGEYTALVAADVLPFADAVTLVRVRGALMQGVVPAGQGTLAALLLDNVGSSDAGRIVRETGAEVVNHNSPNQVVIGGTTESVERAKDALVDTLPDLRFVPLRVSAPFHSTLMQPAEEEFASRLAAYEPRLHPERAAAVTSNFTGSFHEPDALVTNLVRQIAGPVQWLDNMRALTGRAGRIYEIGPRGTLARFFSEFGHSATTISTASQVEKYLGGYAPPASPDQPAPMTVGVRAPGLTAPSDPTEQVVTSERIGTPEQLGDAEFRHDHNVRLAYVAGGMRMGIASPELVIRLARAGMLGFLGTAGLDLDRTERHIRQVQATLPADASWGVNLLRDAYDPKFTAEMVSLLLRLDVRRVEASGFTSPVLELVRYRLSGLRAGPDGRPRPARRLLVKVSRPDVAQLFLEPPPDRTVHKLVARGLLTDEEAALAARVPMADDVCAEADVGSQTTGFSLLPAICSLRDEIGARHPSLPRVRIGAAGGLGTPAAVAAAFIMGADFVLTGSVNQCTPEAATSDLVKNMLAAADVEDFDMAPSAELLEHGGRVPVLRKGVFFPVRSAQLYESYLRRDDADQAVLAERKRIETQYFGRSFDDVWSEVVDEYTGWDPAWLESAEQDARVRRALIVRWYLRDTVQRARVGDRAERLNFQIHSGPAVGAFNREVRGTALQEWQNRHVDDVAWFLMGHAARLLKEYSHRARSSAAA